MTYLVIEFANESVCCDSECKENGNHCKNAWLKFGVKSWRVNIGLRVRIVWGEIERGGIERGEIGLGVKLCRMKSS